jgi:hypothetical protein
MERPQSDPESLRARCSLRRYALGLLAVLGWGIVPARSGAQPACPPATATLAVLAENLSADPSVALTVAGELLDPSATCGGGGATSYASTFTCTGSGLRLCGTISGLRPGAWVNRVTVTVAASDSQVQSQRAVFAASSPDEAAKNSLVWRIYPRTFVVTEASETSLRAQLDAAARYTSANPGPALVTFSRTAFPGTQAPQTIDLSRGLCTPDPARAAALCFTGSRIVVDALDTQGERGGVIWSVGTRTLSLLRLYGRNNVFRGLVFAGSQSPTPVGQADTVVITGAAAQANRIERALVHGPTLGDAVSTDSGAGGPSDGSGTNVIDDSEVTGAEDKGLKVSTGAHLTLRRSCVHDNARGGVQATLGGHAVAVENVVQHNVPEGTGHGLGATGDPAAPSTLVTDGNVVRFAAGRGLSVVGAAQGTFANDYVADNQYAGSRVETAGAGSTTAVPRARFHGVALICNRNAGVSGSCQPTGNEGTSCATDLDCCGLSDSCCIADPACNTPLRCGAGSFPRGFGAVQAQAAGYEPPDVWYGDAVEPGRNAFAWNRNVAPGVNFDVDVADAAVPADGNQWEHCGAGARCDTTAVAGEDIRLAAGASVALGTPPGARAGAPALSRVTPSRPRKGDLVRVFGDDFNAIEGTACAQETAPTDPCSVENPWVERQNQQTQVNRIRILALDGRILATLYPDAVTPTMLAFRMPFDCFTPLRLLVTKKDPSGNRVSAKIPLCDAAGCAGQPAGLPCDDGDVCTTADQCDADGVCRGTPVCGDCVPDGTIDIFDVLREIDIILGGVTPTPTEVLRCDDDCDGDIDVFDVLREIDAVLEWIPQPLVCPEQQAP